VDRARDAISLWREKSRECITAGFHQLLKVILDLRQGAGDNQADIAKDLAWQVVDQVFNWTAEDKSDSSRFKQWETRAGIWDHWEHDWVMVSPECTELRSIADRLNCDFRAQFERLLNQLRNEAFLNMPTAQSTNTLVEGIPQAHSTDSSWAAEKLKEQVAASNFLKFNGNLWTVRFHGGSESQIGDLVGVRYIALVLQQKLAGKPDLKPTGLVILMRGREAWPEEALLKESLLEGAPPEETLPELESRDEVVPLWAAEKVKERIKEIDAILQSGKAKEPEVLLDEKTKCETYLGSGRIKLPGADRSHGQAVFPDKYKKARDAVRKAIKEATDKMAADKALGSLAVHLHDNIRIGNTVSYVGSIAWTVEPGVFPRNKS
jgi:hypothetical protein